MTQCCSKSPLVARSICGRRQMAAPDVARSAFFDPVTVEGCSSWPQHHGQDCSVLPSLSPMSGFISWVANSGWLGGKDSWASDSSTKFLQPLTIPLSPRSHFTTWERRSAGTHITIILLFDTISDHRHQSFWGSSVLNYISKSQGITTLRIWEI